ncbi:MAG: aminopeptidase [Cyclobacteriaceae bacterium]
MVKKVLLALLIILAGISLIYWDMLAYGIGQARGQIRIVTQAQDIEKVLSNEKFPDSLKQKIRIIEEVRIFAIDSIGLKNSENYTTLYDQKGETALWNLSASEAYNFTPKTWSFPFLGSFPYKGFFDLGKAREEQAKLIEENYDTRIRAVGGWSTLGWFSDPILSNMLDRSEGRLADLIIHELTHATLFVKDNIEFNENLASFIGERGTLQFLESKYGKGSFEVENYIMQDQDGINYVKHMLHCTELLNNLYYSFSESASDSTKELAKNDLIERIVSSVDTLHFHSERYYRIFENAKPNNAYFMSFLRYHSSEDSLSNILNSKYKGDLTLFIKGMTAYHED